MSQIGKKDEARKFSLAWDLDGDAVILYLTVFGSTLVNVCGLPE